MAIKLSDIKKEISKSGTNKGKFLYLKDGAKIRVRFLTDFEDGIDVSFHDSYELSVNVPCQERYGRECPYCDNEDIRTRNQYVWCVYDYESKEVKLLMYAINNCSPVGALAALYESYGTLLDRDYEIKRSGNGTNTTYSVIPMDKSVFRNKQAKALSEQAILKAIDKAYPCEGVDDEEDEEDEEKPKKTKNTKKSNKPMNPPEEEPGDGWDEEEENKDYDSMKPQELYKLCIENGIECKKKMSKQYYIDLLKEADGDDWDEEEAEEEDE